MTSFQPDLVVAMGHGSPTLFSGQNVEVVLTSCQNDQIMSGSQAYMLSCLMGQTLARTMEEKKALAVGAYTQEFVWITDSDYSSRILEDPVAMAFRRAVVEPTKQLMRDWNWRAWYDNQVKLYNQWIAGWFRSANPSAGQIVAALEHDRDCLIVYGGNMDIAPGVVLPPPIMAFAETLFGALLTGLVLL